MFRFFYNLSLHNEGGAEPEGISTTAAIDSQPEVVYGKVEPTDVAAESPETTSAEPVVDRNAEYTGVKEKYKDLFEADFKANLDRRMKSKTRESQEMMAIIDPMIKYFGMDDRKALKSFIESEIIPNIGDYVPPTYEETADEGGQAPEVQLDPAELATQAVEMAEKYDNFDLDTDLPALEPLLKKGLSLEQAYIVEHHAEIVQQASIKAAEAQKKATIEAIRTKGLNQVDEAVSKPAPAVIHKADPSTFTNQDLDEIARRVMRGEKIRF